MRSRVRFSSLVVLFGLMTSIAWAEDRKGLESPLETAKRPNLCNAKISEWFPRIERLRLQAKEVCDLWEKRKFTAGCFLLGQHLTELLATFESYPPLNTDGLLGPSRSVPLEEMTLFKASVVTQNLPDELKDIQSFWKACTGQVSASEQEKLRRSLQDGCPLVRPYELH